jgi:hypothetical protein
VTGDVVAELPLAQSTVSEHLRILREAGLVQATPEGTRSAYCLAPGGLAALKRGHRRAVDRRARHGRRLRSTVGAFIGYRRSSMNLPTQLPTDPDAPDRGSHVRPCRRARRDRLRVRHDRRAGLERRLGTFERLLSLWVALAIVVGVAIGQLAPVVPETLARFEYAQVSLPVAVLIWAMIFPMMVQIDFGAIAGVGREPKGLLVTTGINWLVKPFTMFAIAYLFLMVLFSAWIPEDLGRQYLAGAILLGAAPCTAMVFVWSYLTRGDAGYTLVQVAVNDLIMLVAFAPSCCCCSASPTSPSPGTRWRSRWCSTS